MRRQRVFVPPIWFALVMSGLGIYGMSLVYNAVLHGGWRGGLFGGLLLGGALYATGSPLAASMSTRRARRRTK